MIAEQVSALEDLAAVNTIPASWKSAPLAALFRRRRETGYGDLMPLSVFRDYGVIPRERGEDNYNRLGDNLESYQRVEPRDLVLNKMKTWQGSLGVSSLQGIVSPAYIVCEPTHSQNDQFLHYLLRSEPYVLEYQRRSYGVRVDQWDLRLQDFKTIPCLLPPSDVQKVIADYLDAQTQTIDDLIAKKERLIELLEEKRTALITQAVTKGLDPDVPMKNSGVEWIGEIPEHWDVTRLKRVTTCLDSRRIPLNSEERSHMQGPYPYWGANGIVDHLDDYLFDEPLVLLGEDGARFFEKHKDVAFSVSGKIWVNNHIHILRPGGEIAQDFLTHVLNCVTYAAFIGGSTRDKLTQADMGRIPVQLPPVREQEQIVESLRPELDQLSSIKSRISDAIEHLKEYRSALITAAVTGQIDVRDYAA